MAVFIPFQLAGGIVGKLFREFTVTLSVAILISLVISLTTTPMMCARLLGRDQRNASPRDLRVAFERHSEPCARATRGPWPGPCDHRRSMMMLPARDGRA